MSRWLVGCLHRQEKYAEAETIARERLDATREARGDEDSKTIRLGFWLAKSLHRQEEYEQAEAVYREWLPISVGALGDEHNYTSDLSVWFVSCLSLQKKNEDAVALARERLESTTPDGNTIWLGWWLGRSLAGQEQYEQAEAEFLKWLDASTQSPSKNSRQIKELNKSLVELYERWGKPEKARPYQDMLQGEQATP